MKAAIFIATPFVDSAFVDPRVDKQTLALTRAGHEVVVLCTGKEDEDLPRREMRGGALVIHHTTFLQRLHLWWLKRSGRSVGFTSGGQHTQQSQTPPGHAARLVRRLLLVRHNLNTWLFYAAAVPEAVRQRADVYVGHDLPGLIPAYLAARLTGARLVYDSRELWIDRVRSRPYHPWHQAFISWEERTLCHCCDLVIAVSQSVAQILAERYGISEPMVIYNAHPYVDVPPSPEIRSQLTGGTEQRVAIYVGFLDYGKGLENLVDAAQYLRDGIVLAIVGDGALRLILEGMVREKHLEERVRLLGWIPADKVPAYVASADVGVSPIDRRWLNYCHNLDNKFFTYVMGGIPLAVSDQPAKRQMIEKYGLGDVFDEQNPRDIARVINGLLADPARYETIRANCRKAAREELNWEVVSRQYVSALESLVQKQSRPR